MKLPADRNERTKVLVLIGIGAVAVIYGLFAGILGPVLKARKTRAEGIAELRTKISDGNQMIQRMERNSARNKEVLGQIIAATRDAGYILHPRIGNYLLGATEWIERIAATCGVSVEVREAGISQLPVSSANPTPRAFNAYTVRVDMDASTADTITFVRALEKSNPFLSVSAVTILAKSTPSARHSVSVDVQWPIWVDPEMERKLEEQLSDGRPSGTQDAHRAVGTAPAAIPGGAP